MVGTRRAIRKLLKIGQTERSLAALGMNYPHRIVQLLETVEIAGRVARAVLDEAGGVESQRIVAREG